MFHESMEEAWQQRYGRLPKVADPGVARLLTHRSVRSFSDEPVSEDLVAVLVAAAQSAATSSNLQTYSLISVQDPDRRAEVAHLCGDQKQVVGAAWFFAFVADLWRLEESSASAGDRPTGVDTIEMYTVAAIDAALAAERMVVAAEACGLGTCYIGGLRNHQPEVSRLLNLPRRTAPLFGLCLGVPAPEARSDIKPRLAAHAIWFRESYDPDPDVAEYEGRMREFYAAQGMNPDVGWAKRNGRRASDEGMSGRERMREFLDDQGLATR